MSETLADRLLQVEEQANAAVDADLRKEGDSVEHTRNYYLRALVVERAKTNFLLRTLVETLESIQERQLHPPTS